MPIAGRHVPYRVVNQVVRPGAARGVCGRARGARPRRVGGRFALTVACCGVGWVQWGERERRPSIAEVGADVPRHPHPAAGRQGTPRAPGPVPTELEGGLVICKGQERCLYVYPVTEFTRVTEALEGAPMTDRRVRDYSRVLFASASHETPDGQGRITVPLQLRELRRPGEGVRRHRREHPHRGLGRRPPGSSTSRAPSRTSPTSRRRYSWADLRFLTAPMRSRSALDRPAHAHSSGLLPSAS